MKKREYLEDQIALLLGGRAVEQSVVHHDCRCINDIERAVRSHDEW